MKLQEKLRLKSQSPDCAPPVTLAFLGDSVTHGCFEIIQKADGRADCIYDHEAVYHARLKRRIEMVFPNCPVTVINAGLSGGNAVQAAERVRRDVLDAHPDLAVVCLGLNDVISENGLAAYIDGLRSIFSQLRQAEVETVFMTPNMMCTYVCPQLPEGWLRQTGELCAAVQVGGKMDEYMESARQVCREERVTLCDCYADWKRLAALGADVPYLLANGINHPTREMHTLFADRLFNTLLLGGDAL